jgi:hypothetical protein
VPCTKQYENRSYILSEFSNLAKHVPEFQTHRNLSQAVPGTCLARLSLHMCHLDALDDIINALGCLGGGLGFIDKY